MLIGVPWLSRKTPAGSPFSCHLQNLGFPLRGALRGPGSRGRKQTPVDRTGTFPLQRRLLSGHLSTHCGAPRIPDGPRCEGWMAGVTCSPLPSPPLQPWKPHSPDKGCKQPHSFCLLPPLSCLQGIKRIARQGHNDPLPSHDSLQRSCNTLFPFDLGGRQGRE